jgi:hypothetical protein
MEEEAKASNGGKTVSNSSTSLKQEKYSTKKESNKNVNGLVRLGNKWKNENIVYTK